MKIDFTKIKVQVSFDGTHKTFNIAKEIGNDMKFNGSVICDIGFEELARQIYFSDGEVEIPSQYVKHILQIVLQGGYLATIKRYLISKLNGQ